MKKIMLIAIAIIGLSIAFQAHSYAQTAKKKVMVFGKQGGGNSNASLPSEDKPREKKSKKRGTCYLYLDNYTGYYVDVWVEDQYQGRLSPYATSVRFDVWTPGNWTKWYAKSAGGTYYWENDSYCNDSRVFTINLKQ
ncbi:MAG: hypothetical protein H0W12_04835 [Chitinophagaceae bacterium]|nr:hypothetical protein [Chitinophagaceae bacterium]